MITNGAQPNAILEIQSDSLGQWEAGLPTNLEDGLHTVVVTDESGTMQDVAFFSVNTRESVQFIDRIKEAPSSWFIYFVIFFLVVILALAGNNLRLAWKKRATRAKEDSSLKRYSVILSFVSIASSLMVGGLLAFYLLGNNQANDYRKVDAKKELSVPKFSINRLSGAVMSPITNELVKDVTIVHNEVEISTKDGGNFTFSNIESGSILEIKHESLTVPVYFQISTEKQYLDLYFDAELFAKLTEILIAESENDLSLIYNSLADAVKAKIDKTDFIENYPKLYEQQFDSITFSGMFQKADWISKNEVLYPRVIEFELFKNGKTKIYTFVYENLNWKLVE
ncbi:MAG: hypothetical protein P1P90_03595 [Patescibacteria group bacterium]|nr:hypothetical protein [Patescibacteria group bacterium]